MPPGATEAKLLGQIQFFILTGCIVEPKKPVPKDKNSVVDQATLDTYDNTVDEYLQVQASIHSIIIASVSDQMKNCILLAKTAHVMWTKLCSIYKDQGVIIQAQKIAQIYSITCPEGEDPQKTIDEILLKANELAVAGGNLSEAQQAAVLIKAMPKTYHPTIQTIVTAVAINNQVISLEELI
jgi:hypothetical protein